MAVLPTYWCWAPPLGKAANDPRFVQIVKRNVVTQGGTSYANNVCDEIISRLNAGTLNDDTLSITMFNWGTEYDNPPQNPTLLWKNPIDGTGVVSSDPDFDPGQVPFFQNAIDAVSLWTDDFIAQYRLRQSQDARIPDPKAFWMDYEDRITVGTRWFKQWADIKADPRFSTEVVTYDGRTWADLEIPDVPDPDQNGGFIANDVHTIAVRPYLLEAHSRAMDIALFDKLEQEWPNCFTSNWDTTHDGVHVPGEFTPSGGATIAERYRYTATVGGTHQTPYLYHVNRTGTEDAAGDLPILYPLKIQPGKFTGRPYAPWIEMAGEPDITASTVDDVFFWTVRKPIEDGIENILLYGSDLSGGPALSEFWWNTTYDAILRAENAAIFSNPAQMLFISTDSSQLRIGIN